MQEQQQVVVILTINKRCMNLAKSLEIRQANLAIIVVAVCAESERGNGPFIHSFIKLSNHNRLFVYLFARCARVQS